MERKDGLRYTRGTSSTPCRVQVWWPVPVCPAAPSQPVLLGFAEHNGAEKAQSSWSKYIIVAGEINNKQRSDYNLVV